MPGLLRQERRQKRKFSYFTQKIILKLFSRQILEICLKTAGSMVSAMGITRYLTVFMSGRFIQQGPLFRLLSWSHPDNQIAHSTSAEVFIMQWQIRHQVFVISMML